MTLEGRDVASLSWGDANFRGFCWEPAASGGNLRLFLSPPDRPGMELLCEQACDLEADLDYGAYVGGLPAWDVTFEELPNGRWRIVVQIAPVGSLTVECSGIKVHWGDTSDGD